MTAMILDGVAAARDLGAAVMALLDRHAIALEGRHAVVIGRSNIVGKPLALMLIARGATVTVCTSRTPDLAAHTRIADIVIAAAGKPGLVGAGMVKRGAAVAEVAAYLTPVPGGVGPMTVACLVANTVTAAERSA
jgi:methylenetetrahydrofolate dehydrogenase (NADP+)/methenyltetrahydrofolate cyclohydrolase